MTTRSPARTTQEVTDAHQIGVRRSPSPEIECASGNIYGASGDLVTEFRKKIFFLWCWTTRPCLTPPAPEYFVARGSRSQGVPADRENAQLQSLRPLPARF